MPLIVEFLSLERRMVAGSESQYSGRSRLRLGRRHCRLWDFRSAGVSVLGGRGSQ